MGSVGRGIIVAREREQMAKFRYLFHALGRADPNGLVAKLA